MGSYTTVPTLVRRAVVAALAIEDEESHSGTALKGAISSAVADRLATTFPAEAGVDAPALRDSTASFSSFTRAETICAVLEIGTMPAHPDGKPIYLPPFYGATGGPTENGPSALADTASPYGTENRLGGLETEKRELNRSSRGSAPGAQGDHSEGTENPSECSSMITPFRTLCSS